MTFGPGYHKIPKTIEFILATNVAVGYRLLCIVPDCIVDIFMDMLDIIKSYIKKN